MKSLLMFIGGLTIGAGMSWVYHKNKYEEMIQEEVESLREHAKKKEEKDVKTKVSSTYGETKSKYKYEGDEMSREEYEESIKEAQTIINDSKYSNDDCIESHVYGKPHIITPEEFASIPLYDTDEFCYHTDDIISNDMNEIVDSEELFGMTTTEIYDQFGVHEEDSVHIRVPRLKCDYQILRDTNNYTRRNGD